jgi:hypothetical protein
MSALYASLIVMLPALIFGSAAFEMTATRSHFWPRAHFSSSRTSASA